MTKKHEKQPGPEAEATALATQEPAPLATFDVGDDIEQFKDEFDRSSLQIPFLRILQSNSPMVTRGDPQYDEDARPGMYVNTVSGELFRTLELIPVFHYATFIAWRPRNEGGGFVKDYGFEEGEKALALTHKSPETGRDLLPDGNELVRTEVYFALVVRDNGLDQVMLTMTSTQLKKARRWNSQFRMLKVDVPGKGIVTSPPMFFHTWKFSTVPEKNDKGSWEGYQIEEGRPIFELGRAAYEAAKAFRQTMQDAIKQGRVSMAAAEETEPAAENAPF